MISINDLTFLIGSRALYDEANWHIKPGDRVGLIGANGTGKSTLLKIIVGEYAPSSGTISMSKDLKIGYLNQDLLSYDSHHTILHVAMEAFERQNQLHDEIELLLKKIETDYSEEVLNKLSDKQQEFEALDGYNIEYRANEILAGLGFSTQDQLRPLNTFSGGWRMRVMLAKILLQTPDILLLDEPTNHMDLPSIKWLETYLLTFEGAIVIVSHDRYFLDKVVNKTVESRKGKLTSYAGNYSFYLEEKALRGEIQKGEFKNQQAKIKQEERLIERFRAKASKAKMAQSRMKALDKMERVEEDSAIINRMGFNNKGVDTLGERLRLLKSKNSDIVVGGNIGKNKNTPNEDALSDYIKCFDRLFDVVDYFVVNVSSPNTPGLRALQEKEPLMQLLNTLQQRNSKNNISRPILLKIAPDLTDEQLDDIVEIVMTTGIAGVIATNTTIDRSSLQSPEPLKSETGGLSGKPLTLRSVEVVRYLSTRSNKAFPIIGVGGIHSPKDAQDMLDAGASLVQLYTGFIYEGPGLIKKICKELVKKG